MADSKKFLDYAGVQTIVENIKNYVDTADSTLTSTFNGSLDNKLNTTATYVASVSTSTSGVSIGTGSAATVVLGKAAEKQVTTTISSTTGVDLVTEGAVKNFVEGKNYVTKDTDITGNAATATNASYSSKVGTSTAHPAIGSATQPVYVNADGIITAGTSLGGAAYKEEDYYQVAGSYASSSHTHGNITNGGTVGSTGSLVVVTDADKKITTSSVTTTELGYLSGVTSSIQTQLGNKLETSLKGAANGLAELDADGKVPASQLPSYVDDVLEYANKTSFPTTGETGKIYVSKDDNLTYRWSGTAYVEISASLALGETSSTAYAGDKGAANATAISTHTANTSNPHSVTAAQVGAVPTERKVNDKALSADITLSGADVKVTGYTKATSASAVADTDTINTAIGKLEKQIESKSNTFGTVTSVALSMPETLFSVTGSPVSTSGTLTASLVNADANKVFAGPTSGAAAAPSYRSLVAADIPSLTASKISDFSTEVAKVKVSSATAADSATVATSVSNALTIKVGTTPTSLASFNGSAARNITIAAGSTSGTLTVGDGTTTATITLAGKFSDTTYSAFSTTKEGLVPASTTSNNRVLLATGSWSTTALGSAAYTEASAYATSGHTHDNYVSTTATSGTGTFVTGMSISGNTITYTLGTPANTTYSAGDGLTLSGTTFSVNAMSTSDVTTILTNAGIIEA